MSGWTKGPWTYEAHGENTQLQRLIHGPTGRMLARVMSNTRNKHTVEADAHLIAAAPELAEAAAEAREFVHAYSAIPDQPAGHFQQRAKLALDKIDAALAKARGE